MPCRHRAPVRVVSLFVALAAVACTSHKGPPLHVVIAPIVAAGQEARCVGPNAPQEEKVASSGIATLRLTIREHGSAADAKGAFVCDRAIDARRETPTLQIPARGQATVDIWAEAFSGDATPQRVAVGALTGVPLNTKTLADLRLVRAQAFGCLATAMTRPRAFHSATLLPNGEVFILGGLTGDDASGEDLTGPAFVSAGAEVYDPARGTFTAVATDAADMSLPRAFQHAALLDATPPYHILVVGGLTVENETTPAMDGFSPAFPGTRLVPFDTRVTSMAVPLATRAAPAQLITYDPATNTMQRAPYAGITPAVFEAATTFTGTGGAEGLLVAGGIDWAGQPLVIPAPNVQQAAVARALAGAPEMPPRTAKTVAPRMGASVTPLSDNTAFLWGGQLATTDAPGEFLSGLAAGAAVQTAAITLTGATATQFHTATLIDDDLAAAGNRTILMTGGFLTDVPAKGASTRPPGVPLAVRIVTVTPTGTPTVTGPAQFGFDPDVTCMAPNRYRPAGMEAAVKLPRGRVLVTGGAPAVPATAKDAADTCNDCPGGSDTLCAIAQAALFTPPGNFAGTGSLNVPRMGHTMTLMPDGNVLVLGGIGADPVKPRVLADAESYNPRPAAPLFDAATKTADPDDPTAIDNVVRAPAAIAKRCGDL